MLFVFNTLSRWSDPEIKKKNLVFVFVAVSRWVSGQFSFWSSDELFWEWIVSCCEKSCRNAVIIYLSPMMKFDRSVQCSATVLYTTVLSSDHLPLDVNKFTPCSAELISTAYQPWNSVFLSQKNSHSRLISRRNSLPNEVSVIQQIPFIPRRCPALVSSFIFSDRFIVEAGSHTRVQRSRMQSVPISRCQLGLL
jgi:hypothetical protein